MAYRLAFFACNAAFALVIADLPLRIVQHSGLFRAFALFH